MMVCAFASFSGGVLVLRAAAGSRPGGRGTCSLLRQRKVPKRKATHSLRPLRCAAGQTCVGALAGCAVELAVRCARRSDNHGESVHEACALRRACSPRNRPAAGAARWGEPPNSHTGLCFARPHIAGASASRSAGVAERSKGPCGCPNPGFPSGCAEERSGQRIRARDCLSAVKRSEFERDPAGREHRRLPVAKRRDAACRVALSLVTFFRRHERKLLACRATPGLRPAQRHSARSAPRLPTAHPKRPTETIKTIAASAF
jgi:hypothetical protein